MIQRTIPLLHVTDSRAAERFYCAQLGFETAFINRPDSQRTDPCYLGISREGAVIHLSSFSGDGVVGHVVNLLVDNVDALYDEFRAKGVTIDLSPTDQTWGNREMYIRDADGNCLRFLQEVPHISGVL